MTEITASNALDATAQDAEEWWLDIDCSCGHQTYQPFRLLLRQQPKLATVTVRAIVRHLKCQRCGSTRPAYVGLTRDPAAAFSKPGLQKHHASISLMGGFEATSGG